MAIIGDEIRGYVASQINVRQFIHGSGVTPVSIKGDLKLENFLRPDEVINVLNSNTSWVKLASGVSVAASKLKEIGITETSLADLGLAKRYVLNAGFSRYQRVNTNNVGGKLRQRDGFLPEYPNSSYTYGSYGYSPMPGIISADIKALNRGSIKKATVKIKINDKEQFDIIDLLYFRLGYTVLLEWGNSMFFNNSVEKKIVRDTLIDNPSYFFNPSFGGSESYRQILPAIERYRDTYDGNYDGLLGKISNFQWSFNKDGSYDAEITIISLGDVVESLKTNISTDKTLSNFIIQVNGGSSAAATPTNPPETSTTSTPPTLENQPDILEDNKDANSIASMLWVWKWVNKQSIGLPISSNPSITNTVNGATTPVGLFLKPSGDTITTTTTQYEFYYGFIDDNGRTSTLEEVLGAEAASKYPQPTTRQFTREQLDPSTYMQTSVKGGLTGGLNVLTDTERQILSGLPNNLKIPTIIGRRLTVFSKQKPNSSQNVSTESPIKDFEEKDAFFLNSAPKFPLYLRLGALLNYIENNVLPKIDSEKSTIPYGQKPPIFKIDSDVYNNIMYSLPNQISLDPRVCIVTNLKFNTSTGTGTTQEKLFQSLLAFRTEDSPNTNPRSVALKHPNKAYMMNIYLNFNFILESLNSAADERGDSNTFTFLQNICNGINKALGGINNIEPVMDEETNTLRLQDTTPIPGNNSSSGYVLQLYGYENLGKKGYTSNFIRNIDLKTAITPEYATMITVGATAGGYVKGTEATAFSRWNSGLIDRFKEKFTPGNINSLPDSSGVDEAVTNYVEKMLAPPKYPARLGFLPSDGGLGDESTDAIESNISVGTEYFKYIVSSNKSQQGGTVGFIPFKIGFTMDGLSGIKIYNKLHINTTFLPKAYGNTLDLIVTGVTHKLAKSDWETEIEATVIPKTSGLTDLVITSATNTAIIQQAVEETSGPIPATNWEILHPSLPSTTTKGKNIDLIIKAFKEKGVTNPYPIVAALCVIGKETGWIPANEYMNYSANRLPEVWGAFSTTGKVIPEYINSAGKRVAGKNGAKYKNQLAIQYAGDPVKLANFVYGWNGSTPKGMRSKKGALGNLTWGDGYKYRGRGFNQVTWKSTYEKYSSMIGVDLVTYPDKLNEPNNAAKVAVLFFIEVFKYGGKSNPVAYWNQYNSLDKAITDFANANAGSIRETHSGAILKSKEQKNKFTISYR